MVDISIEYFIIGILLNNKDKIGQPNIPVKLLQKRVNFRQCAPTADALHLYVS